MKSSILISPANSVPSAGPKSGSDLFIRLRAAVPERPPDTEANIGGTCDAGQIDRPWRVVIFNTCEGWSRDVSEDFARALVERAGRNGEPLPHGTRRFCERHGVAMPFALAAE